MQRLFSTFPNDWPGSGLLLLRCAAAIALIADSILGFVPHEAGTALALPALGIALALAFALGVFTPAVGIAVAAIELWYAMQSEWPDYSHVLVAIIGISLTMLGPGTWSIDARIYGRKRIDL